MCGTEKSNIDDLIKRCENHIQCFVLVKPTTHHIISNGVDSLVLKRSMHGLQGLVNKSSI